MEEFGEQDSGAPPGLDSPCTQTQPLNPSQGLVRLRRSLHDVTPVVAAETPSAGSASAAPAVLPIGGVFDRAQLAVAHNLGIQSELQNGAHRDDGVVGGDGSSIHSPRPKVGRTGDDRPVGNLSALAPASQATRFVGGPPTSTHDDHTETTRIVNDIFAKQISGKLSARIHKMCLDLIKRISSLQSTNRLITKLQEDLAELSKGRLPTRAKKVSVVFESELLDTTPCHKLFLGLGIPARDADMEAGETIMVFDSTKSIRAAKEELHILHLHAQCRLDLKVADEKRRVLREETRLKAFQSRCMQDFEVTHNSFTVLDLIVEEEQSESPCIDEKAMLLMLHTAYNKVVARAAASIKKQEADEKLRC